MAAPPSPAPRVLVVMGVSGVGKTSLGEAVASAFGWDFAEGDLLHPASNIAKMAAGQPLTDEDRAPWLDRVAAWIDDELAAGRSGVVTCSALKRRYRDRLAAGRDAVTFLYLEGDRATIAQRIAARAGHFMPPSLLDSQFAALEPPARDERFIAVAATAPVDEQVGTVRDALRMAPTAAAGAAIRSDSPG